MFVKAIGLMLRFVALGVLTITYPFAQLWRIKSKRKPRNTSWHYGRELIYSHGIPHWKDHLADFRLQVADKDVLEVGSGNGQWLIALNSLGARSVSAVEPNDKVREYCSERLREHELQNRVLIKNASAELLPFPDASFDLLLCMSVYMFTEQSAALEEFNRVLRPGGLLLLTVNGLGYFLMKTKDGILFSQHSEIQHGVTGIFSTVIKWVTGVQIGTSAINVNEMTKRLTDSHFRLERCWLHIDMDLYPLEHFAFPTNYAFKAIKTN